MGSAAEEIAEAQRDHPPVSACPDLARIPTSDDDDLLYVGSADAASNASLMEEHGIAAVIALGTGALAPPPVETLCIDILDMEEAFIMEHFDMCLHFLHEHIRRKKRPTLVHCVYGQSRSATICVAFIMQSERLSLRASYARVQAARPCIHINPGFLGQLELFDAMQCQLQGASSAHATFRTRRVYERRVRDRVVSLALPEPSNAPTSKKIFCKKCNLHLCGYDNVVAHNHKSHAPPTSCGSLFLEPLPWMQGTQGDADQGKLTCPRCNSKLGLFNWFGIKCSQGTFCQPAFQLSIARIDSR
ncbi:Aste57867_23210 [Aphanomyces stellatus]|uniref:protein-tyrosine-phosphatase n=1 Tax=Aphanomyces stellatus TaxID=120398 RepID=A0A485LM92_9STRA|nr:hypothetical protein As57867_023139 [Aphanomyces stellatus]VFT99857.1 Aste57867_23210 [Aphanomyces stellatus]